MQEKILVVDDETTLRIFLSDLLKERGYRVHVARNGQEGLRKFRQNEDDLVIADIKMPGISGLELLEMIKKERPGTAVIIMTGYGTVQMANEATKRGADDYITKPFDIREIQVIVERAIWRKKSLKNKEYEVRKLINKTFAEYDMK